MSLEGRLEDLGLTDIFQIIGLSRRSGILTVVHKTGTGRLVFHDGNVLHAASDRKSRFGYTLLRKGLISYEVLEKALKIQKDSEVKKSLGTVLIEMGDVSLGEVQKALREHILEVVHDLLSCDSGSFHFELGEVSPDELVLPSGLSAEYLLLEGARLKDEQGRGPAEQPAEDSIGPARSDPDDFPEPVQAEASDQALPLKRASSPPPDRRDLALLTAMIEELSGSTNKSEIILMILRFASEIMNRAVIILVRDADMVGLGQFGLVLSNGSADQVIRTVKIPLNEPSCFLPAVQTRQTYLGEMSKAKWNEYFVNKLGGQWPRKIFVAPLISDGKVIALLYGDNVPKTQEIGETEGLEAFIKVAGFALGKALLQRRLEAAQFKP